MAIKTLFRMLNTDTGKIEVYDHEYFSNTIPLNTIKLEYNDTVTEDIRDKLIEGLENKRERLMAEQFKVEKQIQDLKILEHKNGYQDKTRS